MRTSLLLLLSCIAAASAQTDLSQARVAAAKALLEIGADAAEPHWARIESILPALPPDSMEHAGSAGSLASDLVSAGQDIRGFRVMDEAIGRMSHLPDAHPAMIRLLDWKAAAFRNSRRYRQAAEVRERIAAAQPISDLTALRKAKYDLAAAYGMAGQHEKAVTILQELRASGKGRLLSNPNAMLADSLIQLRRFAEAEALIREQMLRAETDHEKASWRFTLGRLLFEEGRTAEANEIGYDGRGPHILACGSRDIPKELGISHLLVSGAPRNGAAGEIGLRLHAHLAAASELSGYAKLFRIGDVATMASRFSGSQPGAFGSLIEATAAALEKAHLTGGPYRIDYHWYDLIDAARRGGMPSTAERLVKQQIQLIEKYRGKDSPTLDRPKDLLAAIGRAEPPR